MKQFTRDDVKISIGHSSPAELVIVTSIRIPPIMHNNVEITNIGHIFGNFKSEASVMVGTDGMILAIIRGEYGTQR